MNLSVSLVSGLYREMSYGLAGHTKIWGTLSLIIIFLMMPYENDE